MHFSSSPSTNKNPLYYSNQKKKKNHLYSLAKKNPPEFVIVFKFPIWIMTDYSHGLFRPFGDKINADITHFRMLFKWISSYTITRHMVVEKCPHMNISSFYQSQLDTWTSCSTNNAKSYDTRFIRSNVSSAHGKWRCT